MSYFLKNLILHVHKNWQTPISMFLIIALFFRKRKFFTKGNKRKLLITRGVENFFLYFFYKPALSVEKKSIFEKKHIFYFFLKKQNPIIPRSICYF